MQFTSPEQQTATENAVLAWAAASAVALQLPQAVQAGLILMVQQRFNAAIPAMTADGYRGGRISEDATWGRQTADATLRMLLLPRASDEQSYVTALVNAFGAVSSASIYVSSTANLRNRYTAIRDLLTSYANTTQGVLRGFVATADGLRGAVQNAGTTADVAARAREYLRTVFSTPTTSVSTAVVTSTRTASAGKTDALEQATQTPSGVPSVITQKPNGTTAVTPEVRMVDLAPADVVVDPYGRRANLKIIIPSAIVGGLALIWLLTNAGKKGRRA